MTDSPYRLGLISDLHAGSRYGLVPPKWWPQGGLSVMPSMSVMQYLWQCWDHFCLNCPPLDCLIINGDLVEGETPSRRDALDAVTDNFLVQGEMCELMLGMLVDRVKPKTLWVIRGTPFHDGKHFETLESIARNLGAQPWADNRYTGYTLEGMWRGLNLNVTHHMTSGAIYSGTLASRTALFASAAEALGHTHKADLIVRSHLHMKYIGRSYDKWIVLMPCWKAVTPYAIKKMEFYRASLLNDLGAVIVETDGSGKRVMIDDTTFSYPSYRSEHRRLDLNGLEAPAAHGRQSARDPGRSGRQRRKR